jgi:prepilin-type processing-associated H-X9-DG protein
MEWTVNLPTFAREVNGGKADFPDVAQFKPVGDLLQKTRTTMKENTVELVIDTPLIQAFGTACAPFMVMAKQQAAVMQSMNAERQLALAVIMYADAHDGRLPDKLEDLKELLGGEETFKHLMTDPTTGEAIGYIYEKPADRMKDVKNFSETAIIFHAKAGKKNEAGAIGYADGHVAVPEAKAK